MRGENPWFSHQLHILDTVLAHPRASLAIFRHAQGERNLVAPQLVKQGWTILTPLTLSILTQSVLDVLLARCTSSIQVQTVCTHQITFAIEFLLILRRFSNDSTTGRRTRQFLELGDLIHIHCQLENGKRKLSYRKARHFPVGSEYKLIADKADSVVSKEEGLHASALVPHFNSIKQYTTIIIVVVIMYTLTEDKALSCPWSFPACQWAVW